MKKVNLTLIFLLLLAFNLNAQEGSYDTKVKKMLKLSGAAENFDVVVTNMLNLQKEAYSQLLSEEFFEELEIEIKEIGFQKLVPKFVPIYKKHLSEKDLDGIIAFYESEVGRKLAKKTPLIIVDAMLIGAEWGEEIGEILINI